MRISDEQIKKIVMMGGIAHVTDAPAVDGEDGVDDGLVRNVTDQVIAMPIREEIVEELRARIARGEYNPSGDEIADSMIRRAIADRIGQRRN